MNDNFFLYLFSMALITYLIRMLPLVLIKKEIKNRFLISFLHYVPYTVLAVMTIPAIFYSTSGLLSATAGLIVALILAFFEKGLLTVALSSAVMVFVVEWIGKMI